MDKELSRAEELAIDLLKKAERHWPDTLWILAIDSKLYIMKKGEKGEHVIMPLGGVDPDFILDEINIESDGGSW